MSIAIIQRSVPLHRSGMWCSIHSTPLECRYVSVIGSGTGMLYQGVSNFLSRVNVNYLKRVSPSIAPGWIYGADRSCKTNLIEPQGKLKIWQ